MSSVGELCVLRELEKIARCNASWVGNNRSVKCIASEDSKDVILTSCLVELLEQWNYDSSVINLVAEIVGNHHTIYKSGCKSLIHITFNLLKEMTFLNNDMGYSYKLICSAIQDCLEEAINYMNVTLKKLCTHKKLTQTASFSRLYKQSAEIFPIPFVFSESKINIENFYIENGGSHEIIHKLKNICYGLNSGHDQELKNLLFKICLLQNMEAMSVQELRFYPSCITIFPNFQSTKFRLKLFMGHLFKTGESFFYTNCDQSQRRTILIDGDVTANYQHLGHKMMSNCKLIRSKFSSGLDVCDNLWLSEVLDVLEKYNINTILVSGTASPIFLEQCAIKKTITCLTLVPLKVIRSLAEAVESTTLDYITDCLDEQCISKGINLSKEDLDEETLIRIQVQDQPYTHQTIIMSHATSEWVNVKEEEFWHCAEKLKYSLNHSDGRVVPGCGITESKTASFVDLRADEEEKSLGKMSLSLQCQLTSFETLLLKKVLARRALAKAFQLYSILVENNLKSISYYDHIKDDTRLKDEAGVEVVHEVTEDVYEGNNDETELSFSYDDPFIKEAVWRASVRLSCVLFGLDSEVISGAVDNSMDLFAF